MGSSAKKPPALHCAGGFWSEWRGSNSRPRGPKPRVLSAELHPDIHFSAMIPRRAVKIKFFLSVVIPVVKAAFTPFSAIEENPANAGVARLCGVSPCPVPDSATALPKQARYQLRYTRLLSFYPAGRILPNQARYQLRYTRIKIRRPLPGGVSTIPAFSPACKGKICPVVFYIPGAFSPCRITAPAPPSVRPPDRSFPKPRPGPPGPYGRRPPAYGRWAFADPDRG